MKKPLIVMGVVIASMTVAVFSYAFEISNEVLGIQNCKLSGCVYDGVSYALLIEKKVSFDGPIDKLQYEAIIASFK